MIAAALERGIDVVGELELAWRAIPNRFLAVTGTNGKTTDGRAARPPLPHRRRAGRRRRQRRHAALLAGRRARSRCDRRLRGLQLPARGQRRYFAPECAVFLNLAPDHLDRHADLDAYLAAKLRIFANQGNDDVAVYNADEPALAGVDLGGCARRISFCHGAGPDCEVALAEGTIFYDGEPLLAVAELGLLRRAQRRQRDGRRRGGALDGARPRRGPRGPAQLRRRPAPARAGRRDRRRPLRQRLEGDQRRLGDGRAARLRRRRPRDPRRQREGRAVRAAGRAGCASAAPPAT